jgi:hypothetical protein
MPQRARRRHRVHERYRCCIGVRQVPAHEGPRHIADERINVDADIDAPDHRREVRRLDVLHDVED